MLSGWCGKAWPISVSEERACEILGLKILFKEKMDMSEIEGIIEQRDVKEAQNGGQRISLKLGGKSYSAFSNSIPSDVAERLESVRQGDNVKIVFTEKPGTWQGKSVTYRNINDIEKVIQVGETTFSESPAVHPVVHDKPKVAGDSRDDMMRLSYSKDTINAILTRGHINPAEGETEELFIARVFSLIKAGAKTLGE
jgi:hypothetical protein